MVTSGSNPNISDTRKPAASKAGLIARLERAHAAVTSSQRRLLEVIAECERAGLWLEDGVRDPAQWVSAQLGISHWAARRWITAAQALPTLPQLSAALDSGALGLDKVLELSRFATADTEQKLISWARRVMPATVRHRADVACAPAREEVVEIERARYLRYWFSDEGASLCLEGLLPADQGAVVVKALDRMAGRLPDIVADSDDESPPSFETSLEMRRADALYA
ncbi:MAG: DUF222 domain-containing protein, partial [Actinomycetota bacterium]